MNELDYEKKIDDLSAKIDWLVLGYKIGATCLLVFSSLLNLGVTCTIPNFHRLFMDALGPDHPLPIITSGVLACENILPLLAVLWPIAGIISAWAFKKLSLTVIVPVLLLALIVAQFVMTWISLFLPMVTVISGMGDPNPPH